ncbi:MAG: hypothetical protein ACR2H3_03115 [Acidimicrobiales bacterium]
MLAAFALLAGLLVTTTSAGGETGDPPSAAEQASSPPAYGLSTELEQFVTDQSILLESIWAGSRLIGDNHIEVSLTTNRVPPALQRPDITVVQRRHSTAALDRTMEVVTDRLNELLAPGVEPGTKADWQYAAHLNHDDNAIHVQLVDEARRGEVERSLRDEIADGRVRVVDGKAPAQVAAHCVHRDHCDDPFRGGTRLNAVNTAEACTMAFVMRNNSTGDRAQSSASHCAGSPWQHDGIAIGSTTYTRDWGDVDFKVIRQNNETQPAPTNWVLRDAGTVAITLKQAAPGSMGTTICGTGRRTGDQCAPITSTNATHSGRGGFGAFGPLGIQCKGDSGSAVLNNGNNRAYGVYRGWLDADQGCIGGATGVFTWINRAESASGYSVLLGTTSETLAPGQRMPAGYALVGGSYHLIMQSDGNLVMYLNGAAQWSSQTNGNPGAYAVMQNDGNFVIYRSNGTVAWVRPGGSRVAGSRLIMQGDGNLVIYTPSWGVTWHRWAGW